MSTRALASLPGTLTSKNCSAFSATNFFKASSELTSSFSLSAYSASPLGTLERLVPLVSACGADSGDERSEESMSILVSPFVLLAVFVVSLGLNRSAASLVHCRRCGIGVRLRLLDFNLELFDVLLVFS